MDPVLVDTDVFSFAVKRDSRASLYQGDLRGRDNFLSFMTVAEFRRWSIVRNWGRARRDDLERSIVMCHVLMADDAMCTSWADAMARRDRHGRPMATADCWIAATAIRFDIPLVTHNAEDYQAIPGLCIISHAA